MTQSDATSIASIAWRAFASRVIGGDVRGIPWEALIEAGALRFVESGPDGTRQASYSYFVLVLVLEFFDHRTSD
jgi:hypothetical protein